jgi:hypothetical protein
VVVLVDHAVEDLVASYGGTPSDYGSGVVVRRVLIKALVGTVAVEVANVLG